MKIISKRSEILDCQQKLREILKYNLPNKGLPKRIKRQNPEVADRAIHNNYLWFASKYESHEGHHWNAFGLMTYYSEEEGYIIIAEINSPKRGIFSDGPSGVFAENNNGKRHILHRGRFYRIGKEKSLQHFRNKNYDICELDDDQEAILVSSLDNSLVKNITKFVEDVLDFKENHA